MDTGIFGRMEVENRKKRELQPGQPCDHPGCASHLSHPCEGRGRCAAGMVVGPDITMARAHIQKLSRYNAVMHALETRAFLEDWSPLQLMSALVIALEKQNQALIEQMTEMLRDWPATNDGQKEMRL